MLFKRIIPIILILLFVTACDTLTGVTDNTSAQDTEEVVQVASDVPVVEPTAVPVEPTAVPVEPTAVPATAEPEPLAVGYNAPDWVNLTLSNAQTGETFTLADFTTLTSPPYADPEGDPLEAIKINVLPITGTLLLSSVPILVMS